MSNDNARQLTIGSFFVRRELDVPRLHVVQVDPIALQLGERGTDLSPPALELLDFIPLPLLQLLRVERWLFVQISPGKIENEGERDDRHF